VASAAAPGVIDAKFRAAMVGDDGELRRTLLFDVDGVAHISGDLVTDTDMDTELLLTSVNPLKEKKEQ